MSVLKCGRFRSPNLLPAIVCIAHHAAEPQAQCNGKNRTFKKVWKGKPLRDMDRNERRAYEADAKRQQRARKKASRAQAQEQEQKEVGAACE